jgi:hypothetical protein
MKRLLFLLGWSGVLLFGADVSGVHSVYMLPMSHGLDQHLANRLTNDHVFRVVTNAKIADAIFTDRIGEAFESQMDTLFPPPEAEKPPKKEVKDVKKEKDDEPKSAALPTETVNKQNNPALSSSFGRGKGVVFLVDVKSRQVIWSSYQPPKGTAVMEIDKSANDIVARLKKDMGLTARKSTTDEHR